MNIVAIIPARGGSKRLARKNLLTFAGEPLIGHSIGLARACHDIRRCLVSTEDPEIAAVGRSLGAEIIDRPVHLADDRATTASAILHAIGALERDGDRPDAVVTLQPNCPCRPVGLLNRGIEMFKASDADSVITVTTSKRKLGVIDQGYFTPGYQPGMRSQDLTPAYYENGLLYITRVSSLRTTGSLFGTRILPLETDEMSAMGDIDTPLDFMLAEFIFERYRHHFQPIDGDTARPAADAAGDVTGEVRC